MNEVDRGHRSRRGKTAIWQAKLMLLVMINVAQLWILSATIDAALAEEHKQLVPLVAASVACWLITISIVFWWRPAAKD
jgi:steroid 5-alpha reductase family enzyme